MGTKYLHLWSEMSSLSMSEYKRPNSIQFDPGLKPRVTPFLYQRSRQGYRKKSFKLNVSNASSESKPTSDESRANNTTEVVQFKGTKTRSQKLNKMSEVNLKKAEMENALSSAQGLASGALKSAKDRGKQIAFDIQENYKEISKTVTDNVEQSLSPEAKELLRSSSEAVKSAQEQGQKLAQEVQQNYEEITKVVKEKAAEVEDNLPPEAKVFLKSSTEKVQVFTATVERVVPPPIKPYFQTRYFLGFGISVGILVLLQKWWKDVAEDSQ